MYIIHPQKVTLEAVNMVMFSRFFFFPFSGLHVSFWGCEQNIAGGEYPDNSGYLR